MSNAINMDEVIKRINELAKKKKEGIPLTEEELAEKKRLYRLYLDAIKGNLAQQLDHIEVVEEDPQSPGTYKTIWKGKENNNSH